MNGLYYPTRPSLVTLQAHIKSALRYNGKDVTPKNITKVERALSRDPEIDYHVDKAIREAFSVER